MKNLCLVLFFALPVTAWCQKHPLTQGELNRVLNTAFNRLAASSPNAGEIANYVTLDPANASFSVKSTIPFKRGLAKADMRSTEDKLGNDEGNISFLSLSVSGNLLDKNYSVLFSNSSLNSGLSLSAQYNFRFGAPKFTYDNSSWEAIDLKRTLLINKYYENKNALEKSVNMNSAIKEKNITNLQLLSSRQKLGEKQEKLDLLQKSIDSLGTGIDQRTGLIDTLQTTVKEIAELNKTISSLEATADSLSLLMAQDIDGQKVVLQTQVLEKLKKDYDTLMTKASLLKIATSWFTLIGGYSRNSYTTFNASLPFDMQFGEGKQDGYTYGIAINYLLQNRFRQRTLFLNGSISRSKTSNLASLTPTTIEETQQIINVPESLTRTISTIRSAYTASVTPAMAWNLSAHAYYIFGKTPSGVHVFPSVAFQENNMTIANLTVGYLISFRNTVKDQPIVNSELYFRFNDLSDAGKSGDRFFKRNEIGLSFTIPFNIF